MHVTQVWAQDADPDADPPRQACVALLIDGGPKAFLRVWPDTGVTDWGWLPGVTAATRKLLDEHPDTAVACGWCGRAIVHESRAQDGTTRVGWWAVKGVERGYDPWKCDVGEDGRHEPG